MAIARSLWVFFFLCIAIVGIAQPQSNVTSSQDSEVGEKRNITYTKVVVNNKKYNGGGGGSWGWGCRRPRKYDWRGRRSNGNNHHHIRKKRVFNSEDYKLGEFAQCMVRGRCRGMKLDCPLHCGGPCLYDCIYMCKAHCRRP